MKVLHTSDWHLGHILYEYDRSIEQKAMLEQMVSIVEEIQPDVFLLCGDVYHTSQPSSTAQTMFTETIMKIRNVCPNIHIIITAGNHDSAMRHEIFRKPWQCLNVHTIGSVNKEALEDLIIEIPNQGFVIAIPYFNDRTLKSDFFQSLIQMVEERNTDNLPVILSAHTTVLGCDFSGHDNSDERVVGGIEAIDLSAIGEGYDYFALGHIHKAQFIDRPTNKVRYSGTPLAVNFDERFSHTVSIVDIESHKGNLSFEKKEIESPYPLVNLPSGGFASWEEAKELLKSFEDNTKAYIRLNVEIEDMLPAEAYTEVSSIVKDKACRFCCINTKRTNVSQGELQTMTLTEFQQERPIDIAQNYSKYKGYVFDEELQTIFDEVLAEIENESREN